LPDFSWHSIPKRENIYQVTTKLPNGHKENQMAVKFYNQKRTNILHSKALQNLPELGFLV
jgi:hypothetical protein